LIKQDILEMDWRLTEFSIDKNIWKVVLDTTKDGWRLTEANPEEKPTILAFDKPNGETKEIVL
jgi:hypothetical protein